MWSTGNVRQRRPPCPRVLLCRLCLSSRRSPPATAAGVFVVVEETLLYEGDATMSAVELQTAFQQSAFAGIANLSVVDATVSTVDTRRRLQLLVPGTQGLIEVCLDPVTTLVRIVLHLIAGDVLAALSAWLDGVLYEVFLSAQNACRRSQRGGGRGHGHRV